MTVIKLKIPKPSNKHQTIIKNEIPTPFIDKITLVWDYNGPASGNLHYNEIMELQDLSDLWVTQPGGKTAGFNFAKRIKIDGLHDIKAMPLYQCRYSKPHAIIERARLEFVPKDLGADGIADLKDIFEYKLHMAGWKDIVSSARVTRLDVTVDLPGADICNFKVIPSLAVSNMRFTRQGHLETVVLGKSTGNQAVIYDRGSKRKAKGQFDADFAGVRFEVRLRQQKAKLADLKTLTNPFKSYAVVEHLPCPPDGVSNDQWAAFSDCVEMRGLANALALLPQARKKKYRDHINAQGSSKWSPAEIWKKWPSMIDELGLIAPSA